ncbi:hypothetical protein CROQUDRAFT_603881 [Cronartium quercuum f. sp. fusiforme G11]|uniref:Uncharacterized protein n=1 Tax=Cronartium quercuum f. sp. fusiforme G11 TaxID=708437 RepID=A0A9P6TA71_9BASI|nr:hypothetical protein CROQUDRAFT_603881 [Cronartium quercuum f. sp. fusiforme G11]
MSCRSRVMMACIREADLARRKKDLRQNVTKAYDEAVAAQTEQSSQIVNLMSQVRDLRAARDEAEADRAALVTAKRSLEQRLEEIGTEYLSANSEFCKPFNKSEIEAARERSESTELLKANTELEKKIKSLNLKIVDLETRSMAANSGSSPRPISAGSNLNRKVTIEQREYEELMNQLEAEKENVLRATRRSDRSLEDLQIKLMDSERSRSRLRDEISNFENKLLTLRKQNADLQSSESELQLAKRRAERDAADSKEKTLRLQAELERYRAMGALNRSPGPGRRT